MISVIIPVYNGAQLLRPCLESVLAQSCGDLEIILIDDGSRDGSWEIAREFAARDSRIRPFRQENAGVSAARNRGIALAGGEFISFVDGDDLLPPEALAVLLAAAEDADLIVGSHEEFRGNAAKQVIWPDMACSCPEALERMEIFDPAIRSPWGKLYRCSVLKQGNVLFDESLSYGEDHTFNLEFCRFARGVVLLSRVVYRYRRGGAASSLRYYPEKYRMSIAVLEGYIRLFGAVDRIGAAFWQKALRDHLLGTVTHYRIHCSRKEALAGTAAALRAFDPYLTEESVRYPQYPRNMAKSILTRNGKALLGQIERRRFWMILRKKCKCLYVRLLGKRL